MGKKKKMLKQLKQLQAKVDKLEKPVVSVNTIGFVQTLTNSDKYNCYEDDYYSWVDAEYERDD